MKKRDAPSSRTVAAAQASAARRARPALVCAAALAALTVAPRPAAAAQMNFYNQCLLVPLAVYRSDGAFTAVGVASRAAGRLYWYFMSDADDRGPLFDAPVRDGTLTPIIWSAETVGGRFAGVEGSLLVCLDADGNGVIDRADGDVIAGNAFLVDLGGADVAYLPTLDVDDADLGSADPRGWAGNPVVGEPVGTAGGAGEGTVDVQYLIDGAPLGDDTRIYYWTAGNGAATGPQRMSLLDGDGGRAEVDVALNGGFLHVVDPEALSGAVDGRFLGDGLLRWTLPGGVRAFAFSLIDSPRFNALQTVLGNY